MYVCNRTFPQSIVLFIWQNLLSNMNHLIDNYVKPLRKNEIKNLKLIKNYLLKNYN